MHACFTQGRRWWRRCLAEREKMKENRYLHHHGLDALKREWLSSSKLHIVFFPSLSFPSLPFRSRGAMAALFSTERRGPRWKQGWRSSLALPPAPLVAVFAIVVFLMTISGYVDYKARARQAAGGARVALLLLPAALVVVVRFMLAEGRFALRLPRAERRTFYRAGGSPWGVAAAVAVVLLMVAYQSSFHSHWFSPLWRSD